MPYQFKLASVQLLQKHYAENHLDDPVNIDDYIFTFAKGEFVFTIVATPSFAKEVNVASG